MCDKAVNTCPLVFDFVPDRYITQELCDKVVSEDPFMQKYCPGRYKTRVVCDKAVDSYLLALKFVPDWYVTSKTIRELDSAVFCNEYIVFGNLDSDFGTFFSKDIGLNSII